jgi:hypothetical protein
VLDLSRRLARAVRHRGRIAQIAEIAAILRQRALRAATLARDRGQHNALDAFGAMQRASGNDSDGEAMAPPFPHLERLDCNCTGCRLLRAGVCIRCAVAIAAHLEERDELDQTKVTVCSGACREAVECYVASPPGRFDAARHKGAT